MNKAGKWELDIQIRIRKSNLGMVSEALANILSFLYLHTGSASFKGPK